jgi:hypothetical protein
VSTRGMTHLVRGAGIGGSNPATPTDRNSATGLSSDSVPRSHAEVCLIECPICFDPSARDIDSAGDMVELVANAAACEW